MGCCLITVCRKVFEYKKDIYIKDMAEVLSMRGFGEVTPCRNRLDAQIAALALKQGKRVCTAIIPGSYALP